MYCRQCGQKIEDNDKFCFKCGCEILAEKFNDDKSIDNQNTNSIEENEQTEQNVPEIKNMEEFEEFEDLEPQLQYINDKEETQFEGNEEIYKLKDIVNNKEQYRKSKLMEVEKRLHELELIDLESELHEYLLSMDATEKSLQTEQGEGVADIFLGLLGKLIICVIIVFFIAGFLGSHRCDDCGKVTLTKYAFDGKTYYLCRECAVNEFFPFDSDDFKVK